MPLKMFEAIDRAVAKLEPFDFRGKGAYHAFIHWLKGVSIKNKLEYGQFTADEFCQLLIDQGWTEVRTRTSRIFTMPGGGKIAVLPLGNGGYRLDFVGKSETRLPERRLE